MVRQKKSDATKHKKMEKAATETSKPEKEMEPKTKKQKTEAAILQKHKVTGKSGPNKTVRKTVEKVVAITVMQQEEPTQDESQITSTGKQKLKISKKDQEDDPEEKDNKGPLTDRRPEPKTMEGKEPPERENEVEGGSDPVLEDNEDPPADDAPEQKTIKGEQPPVEENEEDEDSKPTGEENEDPPADDAPELETIKGEEPPGAENEED